MREGLGWARAGRVTGNWQLEHGSGYSSLFIYMACAVHLCVRVSTLLRSPCSYAPSLPPPAAAATATRYPHYAVNVALLRRKHRRVCKKSLKVSKTE